MRQAAGSTSLVDKSAYIRLQLCQAANRDEWSARISRGLVRLSTITRFELGYSARSGEAGRRQFAAPPLSLMPVEHLTP
jgi:predicted nucleic acid-binding protein